MKTAHLACAVQSICLQCGNGVGGRHDNTPQDLGELQLPQHPHMHSAENHGEGHVLLRTRQASLGAQEGSGSCRKTVRDLEKSTVDQLTCTNSSANGLVVVQTEKTPSWKKTNG